MIKSNRIAILSLQVIFSSIYIASSYIYSLNILFKPDTLVYYNDYLNINSNSLPYGIEFVIPLIMLASNKIGMDFNGFIFILLLFWTPVVFFLTKEVSKSLLYIFPIIFFMLPQFQEMVTFLIRSYFGLLMFFYFTLVNSRVKYIFFIFSIFSQITSILFFFLCNSKFHRILFKRSIISVSILIACFLWGEGQHSLGYLSDFNFDFLPSYLNEALYRKLGFQMRSQDSVIYIGDLRKYILLVFGLLLITKVKACDKIIKNDNGLDALVFLNVILALLFMNNTVLSSRLGLIAYYFYIPLSFHYLSCTFRCCKIKF